MKSFINLIIIAVLFSINSLVQAQTDCAGKQLGTLNIFPNIPEIRTNPYWKTAFNRLDQGLKNPTKQPSSSKDNFQLGEEIIQGAIAAYHPQSIYPNKSAVKKRLIFLMDFVFNNWESNGNLLGNFSVYHETALAYYMLLKAEPNSINNTKKNKWNKALIKSTDKVLKDRGGLWAKRKAEPLWYNADVRFAVGVYVAGHLLKNQNYVNQSCNFYSYGMQQAILPDGGFNYVGMQNEVFTYHAVCVQSIAWFYLLTGNNYPKQLIERTKNYYPLSIQGNVAEYYTAASWKHYWNQDNGAGGAYIVAGVTGDGENYRIGKNSRHILNPFFYRKNLREKAERNNYMTYDKNIQGPRGKFGNWVFAGTSRAVLGNGKADNGLGKSTFVGAMTLGGEKNSWPLNAALDKVTVEFQKEKTDRDLTERRLSHRFMAMDEKNATSFTNTISGLSTSYRITDRKFGASQFPEYVNPQTTDWYGNQQWIFTKERLIGQLEISPNKNEAQFAVNALIRLTSGRRNWGVKRNFRSLGNNTYAFGDLRFKIHKNGFGGKVRQYDTDTYSPNGAKKSYHFIIQDKKSRSDRNTKVTYNKGEKFNYVVEFYPKWESASTSVETGFAGNSNLRSFKSKRTNSNQSLIHNLSNATQSVAISSLKKQYKTLTVLKSWDNKLQVLSNSTSKFSIPANQHIIVIDDNRKGIDQPTQPAPVNSNQLIADGLYNIVSPVRKQNLLAPSWNKYNAQMHNAGNFSDQRWIFKHLGNNEYTIQNQGTKRYLEVPNGQCGNGKNVATWTNSLRDHKKWKISKQGDKYYFKPKHCTNTALDRHNGSENANVQVWGYDAGNRNQQWFISPASNSGKSLSSDNVEVFPNPAKSFIQVKNLEINAAFTLTDLLGRNLGNYQSDSGSLKIDISALANGIYFLKFKGKTIKFVKE